ncbi:MAG: sensor domain-containing diguanylate cyclase [Candidatus Omnitrophica bacterium]|nr:sensor domain-containing diguanylate cyclase [Candidatus Omnitrophota bacterium]
MQPTPSEPFQVELAKTKRQLEIFYEISKAMRTTLKLDEILYIILTAVTAHAGLGFNRAMLFLVNEEEGALEGAMGIGPGSGEEAQAIWRALDPARTTLEDLIAAYRSFRASPFSRLDQLVRAMRIPLNEASGVIALAALEGMPFEILTEEAESKISHRFLDPLDLDRFVAVPLHARDRVVGVLVADNRFTGTPITSDDVRLLMMCANHAGLAIENSRLYEQTLLLAKTDSLTQLWNHGTFQLLLADELERARRYGKELALALLDLDDFKAFNDQAGHQAGDRLLRRVARLLKELARGSDPVARYGGEEFAMILPETPSAEAVQACERIRARLAEDIGAEWPQRRVTASIGVASFPRDGTTKDELIYAADMALFDAKRSGKNRTCLARRPGPSSIEQEAGLPHSPTSSAKPTAV